MMKKRLILIGIAVVILMLAACGGEATTTTAGPDTTAPVTTQDTTAPVTIPDTTTPVTDQDTTAPKTTQDTTAPVTTAAVTTETPVTEPVVIEIEPQNFSFSMQHRNFVNPVLDDCGRVIKRELYHPHTMEKTGEYYAYSYDENGTLTTLVIRNIHGEKTEYSFTLSEDRKTAIANATDSRDNPYVYRVYFDDSGKIVAEEKQTGGANSFYFAYDEQGRIAEERLFEVNYEIIFHFTYYNDTLTITGQTHGMEGLLVTYNSVGLPISLEGKYATSSVIGEFYSYFTYNRKGICTVARYFTNQEENVCTFSYDEEDRLIKRVTQNRDTGYKEEIVYAYDARGNRIKNDCKYYDDNGALMVGYMYSYCYDYRYDDENRLIEEVYSGYDEDGNTRQWRSTRYRYNDKGRLVQTVTEDGYQTVTDYLYDDSGTRYQINVNRYLDEELVYRSEIFLKDNIIEKTIEYHYLNGVLVEKTSIKTQDLTESR